MLPLVLFNLVTQFLDDKDNHQLIQSCHMAGEAVRCIPREALYVVHGKTGDMYRRYRSIRARPGSKIISGTYANGSNRLQRNEQHADEMWHVLAWLERVPKADVYRMEFFWPYHIFMAENTAFCMEVALRLERLPTFDAVRVLDVRHWSQFRALARFPNVKCLFMKCEMCVDGESQSQINYPQMNMLTVLYITERWSVHAEHGTPIFPTWPSVRRITTNTKIPPGYTNLFDVDTDNLDNIPHMLAPQITHLTTTINDMIDAEQEEKVDKGDRDITMDFLKFSAIKRIKVRQSEEKQMRSKLRIVCTRDAQKRLKVKHPFGKDTVMISSVSRCRLESEQEQQQRKGIMHVD